MNLIMVLALAGLSIFVLVVVIVGLVEYFVESREESAYIEQQDEWMRKGLERANHENKPK